MKLKHTRYAHYQLIVFALFSIASAVLLDWSLNKNGGLAYIYVAISFYVLMSASLIYEALVYKKHRPTVRLAVSFIFLLLALLMFFNRVTPVEPSTMTPFELGGFVFLFSVWILFFMTIFSSLRLNRVYRKAGEGEETTLASQVVNPMSPTVKGVLPVGFYQKKHYVLMLGGMLIAILLPAGLFFYIQFNVFDNLLVNALVLFILLFILFMLVVIIYARISSAPFREFETNLDLAKVIAVIDSYLANPKLHPETSNYLLLVKANYMSNYDTSLASSLWEKVRIPQNPNFRLMYDAVMIERLTMKLDLKGANNYILEALNNPLYTKLARAKTELKARLKANEALRNGASEVEIDQLWPVKSKIKLLVIHNLALRTLYYHLQSNKEEALTNFEKLKELSPESKGIILTLENILSIKEVTTL